MDKYDCLVIGSGPGGYVAAILAAKAGMKTGLIEKYPMLGGTCLNVGCIPSKALLDSAEKYYSAKEKYSSVGIEIPKIHLNWGKMIEAKAKVVLENNKGIEFLMKKNKVAVLHGMGSLQSPSRVLITPTTAGEKSFAVDAQHIILATGSKPSSIKGVVIDKKRIITSTEALSLPEVPKSLLVIGAGVIGLELGSVFARLGAKVQVIEYLDRVLPNFDTDISADMQKILAKQHLEFFLGRSVKSVVVKGDQVLLEATNKDGTPLHLSGDYALVATGRQPYTENLGLEKVGITTERGFIKVSEHLQTSVPNIYAIGDVIGGLMLAHKAEEEAAYVVELIQGQKPHYDPVMIPSVVYTWPEVAFIGKTEAECKTANLNYKVGKFPFMALGRARASGDTEGWVKILADTRTDEILGCHIIGARAVDLIMEAVVAMEYRASAEDIARICHPHPTFSEALKEASLNAWDKRAIHI